MKLYNAIDPSRMHGIPSIGVNMHIEGTEEWEDEQADIVSGKRIDVDFLNYIRSFVIHQRCRTQLKS